jgi:hypothetical protein
VVEQLALKDYLNSAKSFKPKTGDGCLHSQSKFKQILKTYDPSEQASKQDAGATANTGLQSQNFQAFRLLYSKKSRIMSIHFINLNPF